ncbi:unnamed protein product [Linum trigynum]
MEVEAATEDDQEEVGEGGNGRLGVELKRRISFVSVSAPREKKLNLRRVENSSSTRRPCMKMKKEELVGGKKPDPSAIIPLLLLFTWATKFYPSAAKEMLLPNLRRMGSSLGARFYPNAEIEEP